MWPITHSAVLLWNYASILAGFSGNKPVLEQRKSLFWGEKWEVGNVKWEIGEVGSRKLEAPLPLSYSLRILLTCSTESLVSEPSINAVAVDKWAAELPPKWVKHKNNLSKYKKGLISIGNSMICSDIWHKHHEWYFTENTKEGTYGKTWRFKRTELVGFWILVQRS